MYMTVMDPDQGNYDPAVYLVPYITYLNLIED